jgi:hydroxypyruvate isomerase
MTLRDRVGSDADTLKFHGVRLLIEPLNTRDNLGCFLTITAQARKSSSGLGAIICSSKWTSTIDPNAFL